MPTETRSLRHVLLQPRNKLPANQQLRAQDGWPQADFAGLDPDIDMTPPQAWPSQRENCACKDHKKITKKHEKKKTK